MVSLTSLDNSSLSHIVSFLHQHDAIALHASSKYFCDVYPTHITKIFPLDATIDDYVDFCRWIAKRAAIDRLEVCVDINKWKAVIPFNLGESSFEHVTVCSNLMWDIREVPRFPACKSSTSGFLDRNIRMTSDRSGTSLYLCPLNDPDRPWNDQVIPSMPYFASELFGTIRLPDGSKAIYNNLSTISCNGTLHDLDRVPRDITNFIITNATIDQRMLVDMADLDVFKLSIKECQIKDPTIEPCIFRTVDLRISLNILRLIKDTAIDTFIEIECPGTIPSNVDYPVLDKVATVRITGRCQSLEAVGALVARSFPNATPQFHFTVTPV